jgi:hypothetical protein
MARQQILLTKGVSVPGDTCLSAIGAMRSGNTAMQ